jgi:hypothetical protein
MGAAAAFLVLALAGYHSADRQVVDAAYLAADLITRFAIVPLAFACLTTGVVQSLTTRWGLLRHYWVVAKLLLTLVATTILLLHTQPIGALAHAAAAHTTTAPDVTGLRLEVIIFSTAGLSVLALTTALAVYKPRGLTRHGWRRQQYPQRARSG